MPVVRTARIEACMAPDALARMLRAWVAANGGGEWLEIVGWRGQTEKPPGGEN
jgi:hypothetical protein